MNIDTLNAYCGNKLVLFPYLTQGRFNIYQAACCLALGYHCVFAHTVWLQDLLTECTVSQLLGFPILGCQFTVAVLQVEPSSCRGIDDNHIIYDLSLGKITGRI